MPGAVPGTMSVGICRVPAHGGPPRALAVEVAMQEVAQVSVPGHLVSLDLAHLISKMVRIPRAFQVWK